MNAWLLKQTGGLDQLSLTQTPDPTPAPGEAVLSVELAALNPADRYLAEGQYPARPTLPHILGRDGIGTIISLGPGVTQFKIGDRVLVLRSEIGVNRPGTFAQKVAVPVESLAPIPPGWTDEEAAGAALVYLTAYQALTLWGNLPPSLVLVTGASGGVGVATLHLASAMGHTLIALSRSESKREKLKHLGASTVLDPTDPTWRKQLNDRKVDLVIDNIGGPLFNDLLAAMAMHGKISAVGRLAGPVPQFNTASLFFRLIKIGGVHVGAYTPPQSQQAWSQIVSTLSRTNTRPIIDSVFDFTNLQEAFAKLAEGPMGKVLLSVAPKSGKIS
jgi:NADPH:quinone reductase